MAAAQEPYRIYVVEDSPVLRRLLLEFLGEMEGACVVGQSGTAESAVSDIGRAAPDAVIVDLPLQSGNGFDVLEAVMHDRTTAPLAIVLTNFTMPEYRERAAALGATYFFDKSTEVVKMLRVIHAQVEEHQRSNGLKRSRG